MEYVSDNTSVEMADTTHELLTEQSHRIGDMLRLFTSEKLMSERAIDVARFQTLVDTIRDVSATADDRQAAAARLIEHLIDPASPVREEDIPYMLALWADLPTIDKAAVGYHDRLVTADTAESISALKKLSGEAELEPGDWHAVRVGVDVPHIVALSQQVNVESILARSALLLDQVATATTYDHEVLQAILEIETFYAPLLDLLGLHAWEAILKQHTERVRLFAAGLEDEYNEASAHIESVRADGLAEEVVQNVMHITAKQPFDSVFMIDNEETPYGSKSYYSAFRFTDENGAPARYISRIKSPGSWAHKKHYNYNGEAPNDTYAGTFVADDTETMVRAFKEAYTTILQLDSCELTTAPSKTHPIHIRGKKEYAELVRELLGPEFADQLDIDATTPDTVEEPFQVLKVTFTIHGNEASLPVEIQFQTKQDRNRSRLGGASHLCFKGRNTSGLPGTIPGGSSDLRIVNNRKWATMEGGESVYHVDNPEAEALRAIEAQKLQTLIIETAYGDASDA